MRDVNGDEGLIRPVKRKTDPEMGNDAIMVMIPSDLAFLVRIRHAKKVPLFDMNFYDLYQYQTRSGGKRSLTFLGPFLGAPQAVMGMEKMIAMGCTRIWAFGWCGSLQPNLRIGDLVIPTGAICEEGTSQHYPIGEMRPETDTQLNHLIEVALRENGQVFTRGRVWTTDAPYRETREKVRRYQQRDVLAVEMEMSALMTLAIYRDVKLAGLLVVSDELFDLKWHSGFRDPKLKEASRMAAELLLNLVESLGD